MNAMIFCNLLYLIFIINGIDLYTEARANGAHFIFYMMLFSV